MLPDAQIGHFSEKHLDIHNPYSSDLEWELTYNASPFVRKVRDTDESGGSRGKRPSSREKGGGGGGGGGGEIFKANYSVFWVSERRGITPPQSTSKVSLDMYKSYTFLIIIHLYMHVHCNTVLPTLMLLYIIMLYLYTYIGPYCVPTSRCWFLLTDMGTEGR